jgi:hypothetical protein
MKLSDSDWTWLSEAHPSLARTETEKDYILEGPFHFVAAYDEKRKAYLINPQETDCRELICLNDSYRINIIIPKGDNRFPEVRELDGRLVRVAEDRGLTLLDIHLYPDKSSCLVGKLDWNPQMGLPGFFDRPLIQYFYDQSYFELYGRWPRGDYSHGAMGILENYYEKSEAERRTLTYACLYYISRLMMWPRVKDMLTTPGKIQGHWLCLCGSGQIFRECHKPAFYGLWTLQNNLRELYPRGNKQRLWAILEGLKSTNTQD